MHTALHPRTLLAFVTLGACGLAPDAEETTSDATTGSSAAPQETGTSAPGSSSDGSSGPGADETGDGTDDVGDSTDGTGDTSGGELPVEGPSCDGLETQCAGESCCAAVMLPGGTIRVGRSENGNDACPTPDTSCYSDEQPEHEAVVDAFALDKYPATVGRFRQFVAAWDDNWRPSAGEGAHPSAPESGWDASWSDLLPGGLSGSVAACQGYAPWTAQPGPNEDKPMTCVTWYQAQAFCIWDGGRLPTEAEYEFAAGGGDQNRLYPWGGAAADGTRAVSVDFGDRQIQPVGSRPEGAGRWGHLDLVGNADEWVFDCYDRDFYATAAASEENPINMPGAGPVPCVSATSALTDAHAIRGNGLEREDDLRVTRRNQQPGTDAYSSIGVRCARD